MPFEITPEPYVPPGTPAEPENGTSFAITPEPYVPPGTPTEPPNTTSFAVEGTDTTTRPATPPSFIEWLSGGYSLGGADVLVVDFVYPLVATRGVGQHENVITVRRARPLSSEDAMTQPVPVPIVGELTEPESLYYTSILYPFITQDDMSLPTPTHDDGSNLTIDTDDMALTVPAVTSGTLVATISYITYDNSLLFPDTMQHSVPVPQSGTLIVVISYLTYDNSLIYPETMQHSVPTLTSGTLVVVISYITYDNSLLYPDPMQIPVPTLLSGTLT